MMSKSFKSLATTRPGKVLWTTSAIIFTVVALPIWLLYYIPESYRQHPKWTYHQAIVNELMRAFLYHSSVAEIRTPLSLESGANKERFVKITAQNKDLYRGVLADPHIQPCVVGGIWFPTAYDPITDRARNVILYFHGGAFVMGDGRPTVSGLAAKTLGKAFHDAKVLSFSFRLASNPSGRFPAAVQDAVTAYQYLLDQEIEATRIIFAGDSAGCNLIIALLRYIAAYDGNVLPAPFAAILCSPWVDVYATREPDFARRYRSVATDYVPSELQAWGAQTYVLTRADATVDVYVSPYTHPFRTQTMLWLCIGGLEVLRDEGISFADSMRSAGNRVEVHVEPYANHAILGVGNITGFAVEAEKAMEKAADMILRGWSGPVETSGGTGWIRLVDCERWGTERSERD